MINPDDLARYHELADIIDKATSEQRAIKNKWAALPPGNYGDVTVNAPSARFQPEDCRDWLATNNPDLLDAITTTVIDTRKARDLLPPAIYNQFRKPTGTPTVRVK